MKQSDRFILIISSSLDKFHVKPVVDILQAQGMKVVVFESDKVTSGITPLKIHVDQHGMQIMYDNEMLDLAKVSAAWYRKPKTGISLKDKGQQQSILEECYLLQEVIWDSIPEERWLNAPARIKGADKKLTQLISAADMGFNIPETIISNRWSNIGESLPEGKLILKMARSILYLNNKTKVLYTTVFKNARALPTDTNPFPGMWQPYLEKKREWRITIVGNKIFCAAIYTDSKTDDDWRQYSAKDGVKFKDEPFPQHLQNKCLQFLQTFNLKFGAFDFVEDHKGKITFLEVNPNGQYLWLEEELGLPISKAIANELIAISKGAPKLG